MIINSHNFPSNLYETYCFLVAKSLSFCHITFKSLGSEVSIRPSIVTHWLLVIDRSKSPFVTTAARLVKSSLHLINDADKELQHMLDYPFTEILASEEVSEILKDDFTSVSLHLSSSSSCWTGCSFQPVLHTSWP